MTDEPETLDDYSILIKADFDAGDGAALLRIVRFCSIYGWPLPGWAGQAFDSICARAEQGDVASWDDVFGKPFAGKQRRAVQTRSRRYEVWGKVRDIVEAESAPVTNELFERVGRELGIGGKSTVSDLYYEVDQAVRRATA
jgi:hypothetical protein